MSSSQAPIAAAVASLVLVIACGGDEGSGTAGLFHPPPVEDGGTLASSEGGAPANDAASAADAAAAADAGAEYSGEATYYDADGTGACGLPKSNDFMVAAINDEQYTKERCGSCVSVTGPQGTVVVRIVDKCPGCDSGDLDLSRTAFSKIAKLSAGRVKITWRFVPCP